MLNLTCQLVLWLALQDRRHPGLITVKLADLNSLVTRLHVSMPAVCPCCVFACSIMLSGLHPAFLHYCQALHDTLEATVAALNRRPDSLQPFIEWHAEVHSHMLGNTGPGRASAACSLMPALQLGLQSPSGFGGSAKSASGMSCAAFRSRGQPSMLDAGRTGVLAEHEALRNLLEVMRWDAIVCKCRHLRATSIHIARGTE